MDALPDLSDTQVIIRTSFPGQAPQIVENQVTYPLATTMLSVPGAKTVRGYSFFGDSFVYVLFEDDTDLYWARSRVLEYLNQAQERLPEGVTTTLGPDATGVGWIYQYALVDRSGQHDLPSCGHCRTGSLSRTQEPAQRSRSGHPRRHGQAIPSAARSPEAVAYGVTQQEVEAALKSANQETGGAILELAEREYMVRASGYLESLADFRNVPLRASASGVPVLLGQVATIQLGPEMRRGIAELDGQGEVVGGVVILRSGKNARDTIAAVKTKLDSLKGSLPAGVEVVTTYDRSQLIDRAIDNLSYKLLEEFAVVALVCLIFLWHLRSSLVAIITLPLGILMAFIVMRYQGVNANIMSLGGIAIAIGAMVDAAVVMIENAHKHIEAWKARHPGEPLQGEAHWRVIGEAAAEVGPALFFSLLIITLSFLPVFTLEAQEGRLFGPLAFTKTYAMAAAAGLSITLVPVLMGYWIRGHIPSEQQNPLNRWLIGAYRPVLGGCWLGLR
ncbi:efflux RND transporter permease subunit [Halopseudomonas pachastrellae]|nr:efflux RND transporter permease subunit [Halopseudomonas pachastrellae]